ncbi:MAG: ERCC4 domain-containing protein [Bacteroidales bacterium]|jgi:Fanconi anemia group M protein|nr:ERCC4 domain-containing protein [Bacteroidales bacterium]
MNITIIADNRERASGIPELLAEKNVLVMMKQLAVGDYMIDGDIVIERKTSTDFVQSILSGHLFDQCARLRKTGLHSLIIVEGNPFNTRHHIKPEAIKGALLSVSLSWQIPVIRSSGIEDTAQLMIMASEQQLNPPFFIRKMGKKPKKEQKQQHYLIQTLPGIGPALAQRLLAHFNSIEQIVLADMDSLIKVEGVGKQKAKRLFEFFRKEC